MRREVKSLRIGVHHANGVVWGLVRMRTRLVAVLVSDGGTRAVRVVKRDGHGRFRDAGLALLVHELLQRRASNLEDGVGRRARRRSSVFGFRFGFASVVASFARGARGIQRATPAARDPSPPSPRARRVVVYLL
jgi:hypothetical protein